MPVEVMARRGRDTLCYGPLKPVGLKDPRTGREPFAVVQLRRDNAQGSIYNIVGFQTHLKWPEQKRVFSMIPGLEQRGVCPLWGDAPEHLPGLPPAAGPVLPGAEAGAPDHASPGQITGVEGYVESTASGCAGGYGAGPASCRGSRPSISPGRPPWARWPFTSATGVCGTLSTDECKLRPRSRPWAIGSRASGTRTPSCPSGRWRRWGSWSSPDGTA